MSSKYYIVSFDVTCDKRRRKLVKVLEEYGCRIQYSVFECYIRAGQYNTIKKRIDNIIKDNDRVHYHYLCSKDRKKVKYLGKTIATPSEYWVI